MIAIPHYIGPEDYLALESQSSIRHEYQRGLVYAMAGGSDNHERIAFNLLKLIDNHLGDASGCRFHAGNVKVNYLDEFDAVADLEDKAIHRSRIQTKKHIQNPIGDQQHQFFYHPDAFVTCDVRDREDRYIKRYPKLIVEVLSPSTEAFDCGDKFKDYQLLDSLEEYVLISQEHRRLECRRRSMAGDWETVVYELDDLVVLTIIGLEFGVAELYRGIEAT
ncbi:Uma2 family endonuclease [Leptothoe kymatousa]|uniref:Uma2 family endonuclease n=1 Tax=Leptothoe kymatousa TAU-MAC 1615 TaxID=2364775 RepID=A0ABS5Y2A3_9CYAN|nr:Uma2 family endonuclease [Leptothoe kymatousa]MBT9311746.1 Uma2 family endonuclease [Leptothoe kymatousa TAU-MAC 1615]